MSVDTATQHVRPQADPQLAGFAHRQTGHAVGAKALPRQCLVSADLGTVQPVEAISRGQPDEPVLILGHRYHRVVREPLRRGVVLDGCLTDCASCARQGRGEAQCAKHDTGDAGSVFALPCHGPTICPVRQSPYRRHCGQRRRAWCDRDRGWPARVSPAPATHEHRLWDKVVARAGSRSAVIEVPRTKKAPANRGLDHRAVISDQTF